MTDLSLPPPPPPAAAAKEPTDSPAQHVLTTHDPTNLAVFTTLPSHPKQVPSPYGWTTHIYTTTQLPPDVSYTDPATASIDLTCTAEMSQIGLANIYPRIVPDGGLSTAILCLRPGAETPMHRTRTVDAGMVVEGMVDLWLDSGEVRTLRRGDTFVQRGTSHKWVNRFEDECRLFAFCVDARRIVGADGGELGEVGL